MEDEAYPSKKPSRSKTSTAASKVVQVPGSVLALAGDPPGK